MVIEREPEDEYQVITKDGITELQLVKAKDEIINVSDTLIAVATYAQISAPTKVKNKDKYHYSLSYKCYNDLNAL